MASIERPISVSLPLKLIFAPQRKPSTPFENRNETLRSQSTSPLAAPRQIEATLSSISLSKIPVKHGRPLSYQPTGSSPTKSEAHFARGFELRRIPQHGDTLTIPRQNYRQSLQMSLGNNTEEVVDFIGELSRPSSSYSTATISHSPTGHQNAIFSDHWELSTQSKTLSINFIEQIDAILAQVATLEPSDRKNVATNALRNAKLGLMRKLGLGTWDRYEELQETIMNELEIVQRVQKELFDLHKSQDLDGNSDGAIRDEDHERGRQKKEAWWKLDKRRFKKPKSDGCPKKREEDAARAFISSASKVRRRIEESNIQQINSRHSDGEQSSGEDGTNQEDQLSDGAQNWVKYDRIFG